VNGNRLYSPHTGEEYMVSPSLLHKALPIALLAALALAGAPARAGDFEDMVAAERAFAADASARNTRDAFLAAYDREGVAFAPGPVNAQWIWEARKPNKNHLEWAPEVAEIAASGELGYTSGPWRMTAEGEDKPSAFGHFFTVWRKDADGHWKVLVDHGISHGEVPFPDKVTRRGGIGAGAPPTWPVGVAELRNADLLPPGALDSRVVSADFWRLREQLLPGSRASGQALPSRALRVDTGLVIAKSGELGATWGGGEGSPGWIRVWRRPAADDAPGRGWVLVAELVTPAPEPVPTK
jgi:ketosteroid isomerase-like protein